MVTTSQLLFTIATLLLSMDCEALFFNDGCLELEIEGMPRSILPKEQVRKLRDLLNRPDVVTVLEQD